MDKSRDHCSEKHVVVCSIHIDKEFSRGFKHTYEAKHSAAFTT